MVLLQFGKMIHTMQRTLHFVTRTTRNSFLHLWHLRQKKTGFSNAKQMNSEMECLNEGQENAQKRTKSPTCRGNPVKRFHIICKKEMCSYMHIKNTIFLSLRRSKQISCCTFRVHHSKTWQWTSSKSIWEPTWTCMYNVHTPRTSILCSYLLHSFFI